MIYAIVVVLVLIADQAMKYLTATTVPYPNGLVELIPNILSLRHVHNTGAAFSVLEGARWFLIAVSLVFVIAVIILISREVIHTKFGRWMAVLVIAGALGNCIDRALYGYVVDMFQFGGFLDWFPVFNVADIFVTVCGLAFCVHLLFYREPAAVKAANEPEFVRRRRAEKEARQAREARSSSPRRQRERETYDSESLFADWGFGAEVQDDEEDEEDEPAPAPRRRTASRRYDPEEERPRRAAPAPEPGEYEPDEYAPEPRPRDEEPFPAYNPPEPGRRDGASDSDGGTYSLEDILAEFGDY